MLQPNSPQPDNFNQPGSSLTPLSAETSTAEYHFNTGKNLYQSYLARSRQQDLDAAIQHFQKAVEMQPTMAEAYVQLASALWDQGTINLELAQFYCETAIRLDPSQAEANLYLGYFLQQAGFLPDAITQYELAIRKGRWNTARPRIALGSTLVKQSLQTDKRSHRLGLVFKGVSRFVQGCLLVPFDAETSGILKEAFLTDIQVYSLSCVAQGLKQMGLASLSRRIYRLGINVLPGEALFYNLLGDEYLFDMNDPASAVGWYRQACDLEPYNMRLLRKLGKAYAAANATEEAVKTFQIIIESECQDFDALYSLAQLHAEQKDYFKALYYFKEAEKLRSDYPYLHSNMAYVLFKMEDIDGAYEKYKTALQYGTESQWMSYVAQTLGTLCYQYYSDTNEALEYYQHSLQFNPENKETMSLLADLYFETGQMEMAIASYKTILILEPTNADCYSSIGYILWQLDRNQAAIDAYMAAIHYDASNYIAYNNLGVIYMDEQACPEKALPLFQTALTLKPDYTLACFNVGRAYQALGNTMDSAEYYSQALVLNQRNPELEGAEIQSYLDRLFD